MIPTMSNTIKRFAVNVQLQEYEKQTDPDTFQTVLVQTLNESIKAVVQPANPERLKAMEVDYNLQYLQVHSVTQMQVGQYVEYNGTQYKIVTPSNWQLYGYSEVIAEEVKGEIT